MCFFFFFNNLLVKWQIMFLCSFMLWSVFYSWMTQLLGCFVVVFTVPQKTGNTAVILGAAIGGGVMLFIVVVVLLLRKRLATSTSRTHPALYLSPSHSFKPFLFFLLKNHSVLPFHRSHTLTETAPYHFWERIDSLTVRWLLTKCILTSGIFERRWIREANCVR